MTIDEIAARGFSSAADAYERARPGYAAEAVAWLCERMAIGPGRTVLDLAAGTGKLTRDLIPTGARIVAVEPLDEMREQFERAVSGIEALAGTAEEIPLPDQSVDAVVCAQAFHWFDPDRALPEIHRVLRPGGALGLIWNTRDLSDPIQVRLDEVLARYQERASSLWADHTDRAVAESALFGPVEHGTWPHQQRVDLDELIALVLSRSYVASLDENVRGALLDEVRDAFADEPEPIVLPYVVDVFVAARVPG